MTESANSLSVTITPTYVANKYDRPTWQVLVNGNVVPNAILEKVELGFGSDISSASFFLPKNPLTSIGDPAQDDIVEVIANGKTIFKGPIRVIVDHIGNDGLKISYTAFSDIVDLNRTSIIYGAFNSENADYNVYLYNLPPIFSILGINAIGVPNVYPGEVNVTDQTLLAASESLLNKVGNYKLYYDMINQTINVYELQTGGINTRSFLPGKNIIKYDINKSTENTVDQITVAGPWTQITKRLPVSNPAIRLSPSGRYEYSFTLTGKNIRNITVEGYTREQPKIIYDMSKKINKTMIKKYAGSTHDITVVNDMTTSSFGFYGLDDNPLLADDSTQANDAAVLRPSVISQYTGTEEWTQVPVSIVSRGSDEIIVYISEVPKMWEVFLIDAYIPNSVFGISPPDQNTFIQVVDIMDFTVGPMRVTFTVDASKPLVSVGSGPIDRIISDNQYQITKDQTTGISNAVTILQQMSIRANAEYARLHYPKISGNITILGDETVNLRQTVLIEGLLLDILHVSHNFTNGYTTDVTLTNERFVPNIILRPPLWMPPRNLENEKEKRKGLLVYNEESHILLQKNQQSTTEAKQTDTPPNGGDYSVLK